jgi:hypothetical protein
MSYVRNGCLAVEKTGLSVSFGTSYVPATNIALNLNKDTAYEGNPVFQGLLQVIRVRGTVNGGQSDNITLKGYADSAGTRLVLEPTQAVLEPDITGGQVSATFLVDAWWTAEVDTIYFWIKTQNHIFTLTEIECTWRE